MAGHPVSRIVVVKEGPGRRVVTQIPAAWRLERSDVAGVIAVEDSSADVRATLHLMVVEPDDVKPLDAQASGFILVSQRGDFGDERWRQTLEYEVSDRRMRSEQALYGFAAGMLLSTLTAPANRWSEIVRLAEWALVTEDDA